jgi:hypothetical protein
MPDLHSRPGASKRIHLVFTGRLAETWNGLDIPDTAAYGGDVAAAWATAAEPFSPFDVDVTTEAPHDLARFVAMEVIVGGDGSWHPGGTGVTSRGSFGSLAVQQRNYVFSDLLGTPDEVGRIIAHEVGHAMGLNHQSTADGVDDYATIDATKSPIMGNPFTGRAIWWNGHSMDGPQDDLAVLASLLGYSAAADGLIRNTAESRTHTVTHTGGDLTVTVSVPAVGAMLDAKVVVKDAADVTVGSSDTTSLGEEVVIADAPAGDYTVEVSSAGQYGDVGSYTLSADSSEATMAYRDTVQADSPLFYWPMDEAVGATSYAALVGGTAITAGAAGAKPTAGITGMVDGTAVQFDGVNDFASVALNLSSYSKLIVECLLLCDSYLSADALAYEFGSNLNSTTDGFQLNPSASTPADTMSAAVRGDSSYSIAGFARPSTKVWRHIACVFDKTQSSGEASIYVDGNLQTAVSTPFDANNTNAFGNTTLYLFSRAGASLFAAGAMQHLAIYSALSGARIAAHAAIANAGYSTNVAMVVAGDSISTEYQLSNTQTLSSLLAASWNTNRVWNVAVPQRTATQMQAAAAAEIVPLFSVMSGYTHKLCNIMVGINDVDGVTANATWRRRPTSTP